MKGDETAEFVYFVATDSDTETEDVSDNVTNRFETPADNNELSENTNGILDIMERNNGRRLAFSVGSESIGTVKAGFTNNGNFIFDHLNLSAIIYIC